MKNTAVPVSPAVRRSGLPEYVRKDDIVIKRIKSLTPARSLELPEQAPLAGAAPAHDA